MIDKANHAILQLTLASRW